jgi:rRNA maturation endonuclease Nob1
MKLKDAKLCVQCDTIYSSNNEICPSCGSSQFLWLYNILNREGFEEFIEIEKDKKYRVKRCSFCGSIIERYRVL